MSEPVEQSQCGVVCHPKARAAVMAPFWRILPPRQCQYPAIYYCKTCGISVCKYHTTGDYGSHVHYHQETDYIPIEAAPEQPAV